MRVLVLVLSLFVLVYGQQPNILLIMSDDLGWDDVSFHGSKQIYTPNIDALAMDGIRLNNYYVEPLCTPSRAALLAGRQPSHTGMQHYVVLGMQPYGLPLNFRILPQYLKDLNYSTHLVGKWHLGSFKKEYWPTHRGFDSYLGYNNGANDYYDHSYLEGVWGFDFWDNETLVAPDYAGRYSTEIFEERAKSIIRDHNSNQPLFIMLSFQAVHTGNSYNFFQAPKKNTDRFSNISDCTRRTFAGMLSSMDDAIGAIVEELENTSQLNNTIIVFTTDNGGQSYGTVTSVEEGAGSNWPLRGTKGNFWEGGIRGASFVWSTLLQKTGQEDNQLMHITDWLPTLYAAGGGKPEDLPKDMDGKNHWDRLKSGQNEGLRDEIVLVFDGDVRAYRYKNYKLVSGPTWMNGTIDQWYEPSGRDAEVANFTECTVDQVLQRMSNRKPRDYAKVKQINCGHRPNHELECKPEQSPCLFDIEKDPCEYKNIASSHAEITQTILSKLNDYERTVLPPINPAKDPRCSPALHDHVWKPCF